MGFKPYSYNLNIKGYSEEDYNLRIIQIGKALVSDLSQFDNEL